MTRRFKFPLTVPVALIIGYLLWPVSSSYPAMMLSVSTDGYYAVSSHRNGALYLWDIANKDQKLISQEANIYSAYFINNTTDYIFQTVEDEVQRINVDGTVVDRFQAPSSYGQVMTADGGYIHADVEWSLRQMRDAEDDLIPMKADGHGPGFHGTGKLLNLSLSEDANKLLSAGRSLTGPGDGVLLNESAVIPEQRRSTHAGVVLWDLAEGLPIFDFPGNSAKTHATLSPDGQYVVSVDENSLHNVWRTDTGQRAYDVAFNFAFGRRIEGPEPDTTQWDNSGARFEYPDDLPDGFRGGSMIAVQFISDTEYLTFYYNQPYAVLYELGDPFALAILDLGERPFPSVSDYSRNASIATAPQANVLVTGHRDGDGITVYRFDPETRTLEREWVGRSRGWWPF